MATAVAAADPIRAVAPRLISSALGPELDPPPAPVCGAPEGGLVLVGGAVGVPVGDGLVVLVGVGVAVAVGVGVPVPVCDGVLDELDELDVPEVGVPAGADVLVVYVVAPAATDTKMDCSYSTPVVPVTPVPPGPFQQPIAHSTVPGAVAVTPATLSSAPTLPSSVPLNGAVRPAFTAGEISDTGVPVKLNSSISAEVSLLVGHASVVDQVGVEVSAPVLALSTRSPGCAPTPANAVPAASRPAPAIMPITPRTTATRPVAVAVRNLTIAGRGVFENF
jgi:hypothetical protein